MPVAEGSDHLDGSARVEVAVGVLMQRHGWPPTTARVELTSSALTLDVPVENLAQAVLASYPRHPHGG